MELSYQGYVSDSEPRGPPTGMFEPVTWQPVSLINTPDTEPLCCLLAMMVLLRSAALWALVVSGEELVGGETSKKQGDNFSRMSYHEGQGWEGKPEKGKS